MNDLIDRIGDAIDRLQPLPSEAHFYSLTLNQKDFEQTMDRAGRICEEKGLRLLAANGLGPNRITRGEFRIELRFRK